MAAGKTMNNPMKHRWLVPVLIAAALDAAVWTGRAQTWETTLFYKLGESGMTVACPSEAQELNCLLGENSGGYVAVWDTVDSAIVERRDAAGTPLWAWMPPTPLPETNELTRVVLSSRTHTLWCSAQRWFFLDNTNGAPVRAGLWTLPYLDPSRIIIQNDNLYVLYGANASIYNTNMEFQGTIPTAIPEGYWQSFAGSWLVDLRSRTNNAVRLATLEPGIQVSRTWEFGLPSTVPNGYTDSRVLGADTNSILLLSSIHWPALARTSHYFSLVDRAGNVGFQHQMEGNCLVTGHAVVEDGWLLSARYFAETESRHVLYRADAYGRPHLQVVMDTGSSKQYRVLNTRPPRAVSISSPLDCTIHPIVPVPLSEVFFSLIWPPLAWSEFPSPAPLGTTNAFWMTPIHLNNI